MFSKKKGASWTYDTPSYFEFCLTYVDILSKT